MEETVMEGKKSLAWLLVRLCIVDLFGICILIGFWWYIRDIIMFMTNRLIITNKRVTGKIGVINTEELDCPLRQITGVKVSQGVGGKMFNYGTVAVTTAANIYEFKMIARPNKLKTVLLQQVEKA